MFKFAFYERLKLWWFHSSLRKSSGNSKRLSLVDHLCTAALAKLIAATVTYPHEVVRTRMRQQTSAHLKYPNVFAAFAVIYREEGLLALYGGLSPHLLRVVPNSAIIFVIIESICKFYHVESL